MAHKTQRPSDCKCGPQFMPEFIRRPLSRHFNECCRDHDDGYTPFHSRRQVEESFRRQITHLVETVYRPQRQRGDMGRAEWLQVLVASVFLPTMTQWTGWLLKSRRKR